MKSLEDDLRAALRRQEPPPGFAARVMSRLDRTPWWRAWRRWAVAAAMVLVVAAGAEYRHQRAERIAGEAARRQVLQALRITGAKLRLVQSKVQQTDSNRSE